MRPPAILRGFLPLALVAGCVGFLPAASGQTAALVWTGDARSYGGQRLTAVLAEGQPRGRVLAAVWVRAAKDLAESAFAAFRRALRRANEHVVAGMDGDRVDVRVPGLAAPLQCRAVAEAPLSP